MKHSEESANVIDVQIKHALNAENEAQFLDKGSFRLFDKAVHPNQIQIGLSPTEKDLLIVSRKIENFLMIISVFTYSGFSISPKIVQKCFKIFYF